MTESEEELKSPLMRVKEESEKVGLKFSIQETKIIASSPITLWQIDVEKVEAMTTFLFLGSKITTDGDYSHQIRIWLLLGRKAVTNLHSVLKSKDITLPTKVHIVKATVFPVVMYRQIWELDNKEGRVLKNWCFPTMILEKTLKGPLESKEIKPVNLKVNQPWVLIGRTDTEAKVLILWPPDVNSWLIGKEPDAGWDWGK